MAKKEVNQDSKDARKRSEETLAEQSKMKPVPSQDDADKIKLGEAVEAEEEQPDGPAKRAAERVSAAEGSASYQTRASKGE